MADEPKNPKEPEQLPLPDPNQAEGRKSQNSNDSDPSVPSAWDVAKGYASGFEPSDWTEEEPAGISGEPYDPNGTSPLDDLAKKLSDPTFQDYIRNTSPEQMYVDSLNASIAPFADKISEVVNGNESAPEYEFVRERHRFTKGQELLFTIVLAVFGTIPLPSPVKVALWSFACVALAHLAYRYFYSPASKWKGWVAASAVLVALAAIVGAPIKATLFPDAGITGAPQPTPVPQSPSLTINLWYTHVIYGPPKPCTYYLFSTTTQGALTRAEFRVQVSGRITNFRVGTTDAHVNSSVRFGQMTMTRTGCKIRTTRYFSQTPLFQAYETSDNVVNVALDGILPGNSVVMGVIGQNGLGGPPIADGQLQYEDAGQIKSAPVIVAVHPMFLGPTPSPEVQRSGRKR